MGSLSPGKSHSRAGARLFFLSLEFHFDLHFGLHGFPFQKTPWSMISEAKKQFDLVKLKAGFAKREFDLVKLFPGIQDNAPGGQKGTQEAKMELKVDPKRKEKRVPALWLEQGAAASAAASSGTHFLSLPFLFSSFLPLSFPVHVLLKS